MDCVFWGGSTGYVISGGTRQTLLSKPAISCDTIDCEDGIGTMTIGGVETAIDAPTLDEVTAILTEAALLNTAPETVGYAIDGNGKYLGLVPVSQAAQIFSQPMPADQDWTHLNGVWSASVPLAQAQSLALAQIDNAAGSARLRYITDVPGQQAVYLEKLSQSQAWVASPTGTVPPYVAAEATAMAKDATTAANLIINTANAWGQQLSPAIEGARRAGKIAVTAASTTEAVATALANSINQLNAF